MIHCGSPHYIWGVDGGWVGWGVSEHHGGMGGKGNGELIVKISSFSKINLKMSNIEKNQDK